MARAEIRRKFDEIVAFAEVERFLDTPVKRYSSGMYVGSPLPSRHNLEPEILIVDEVLAVGDAAFQKKCLGKMEQVGREGRTVLFVSHNMSAIEQLCDRCPLHPQRPARPGQAASPECDQLLPVRTGAGGAHVGMERIRALSSKTPGSNPFAFSSPVREVNPGVTLSATMMRCGLRGRRGDRARRPSRVAYSIFNEDNLKLYETATKHDVLPGQPQPAATRPLHREDRSRAGFSMKGIPGSAWPSQHFKGFVAISGPERPLGLPVIRGGL